MTSTADSRVSITYVRVPMRDGVELCAKITRPVSDGVYPAIMEYNPYRRLKPPLPNFRDEYPPSVPYLAEGGYVVVQFDVRGTGNSGGSTTDIYNDEERQDACDMVGWIADQPWCNGSVGMIGKSYSAVVQWQVAVENPPALKAIIVRSANDDVYTEWVYPGGCLRPYMLDSYSAHMNTWNFAPPDPDIVGEQWETIWQERLEKSAPWGIGYVSHPLQGPYWQDRSLSADYSRVQCAVMVIGGWSDCYPTALLRAYENLDCPKKALVGPWGHWYGEEPVAVPGPRVDTRPIYQKWFDHWLKGIDNGVMEEPPVTLFVRRYSPPAARMAIEEPGEWRSEMEWPLARQQDHVLYLGDASLDTDAAAPEDCDEFPYLAGSGISSGIHWGGGIMPWGTPVDQRLDDAHGVSYTSHPLEEDMEVTGTPVARLFVSSSARVAYLRVKLIDVAPDGTAKLVRYGGLNASHRQSHADPQPLIPGDVHEIHIPLKAMSYVFERAHRLRVSIAGADFQNAWPVGEAGVHAIHRGGDNASHIVLPVIPPLPSPAPVPDLVQLPPADPESLPTSTEYAITQDLAAESTTLRLGVESGDADNRLQVNSAFTVSNPSPETAVLNASGHFRMRRPQFDLDIRSEEQTRSDAKSFHHSVQLRITRDGEMCFEKDWSVVVPRPWN